MTAADDAADIRSQLQALLDGGTLSPAAQAAGAEILSRLDAAARVSIFGLPGAGKTRVMNLLAGEAVIPNGFHPPTLALRFGTAARTRATLADGDKREWDGLAVRELFLSAPIFVEFDAPLPALRTMSLLMVVADGDPSDQRAAMRWAARRTDIALWCSQGFDAAEAEIWARAPEALLNNAYLILTGGRSPAAKAEFLRTFPVDATAVGQGLPEGAAQMIEEVRRCAERGRQGLIDGALLFLSRNQNRRAAPTRTLTRPLHHAAGAPARPLAANLSSGAPTRPLTEPRPEPQIGRTSPARRELSRAAVDLLRRRAGELRDSMTVWGAAAGPQVLGHCLETMEQLVQRVTAPEAPEAANAEVEALVMDAADVILLLQSEQGMVPAADAVTLLLQLRRELEARLAA